jgi:hypothetical protein
MRRSSSACPRRGVCFGTARCWLSVSVIFCDARCALEAYFLRASWVSLGSDAAHIASTICSDTAQGTTATQVLKRLKARKETETPACVQKIMPRNRANEPRRSWWKGQFRHQQARTPVKSDIETSRGVIEYCTARTVPGRNLRSRCRLTWSVS